MSDGERDLDSISDAIRQDLLHEARLRDRDQRAVNELIDLPIDVRRWAYQQARRMLSVVDGYELAAMNRKADPAKWSMDFRLRVIEIARAVTDFEENQETFIKRAEQRRKERPMF